MGGGKRSWDADDDSPSQAPPTGQHRVMSPRPQEPGVKADSYYRQLYTSEPDFRQLARQDADFKAL